MIKLLFLLILIMVLTGCEERDPLCGRSALKEGEIATHKLLKIQVLIIANPTVRNFDGMCLVDARQTDGRVTTFDIRELEQ